MKEKITLFIALSFLVGLTAYKKSFSTNANFSNNTNMETYGSIIHEKTISKNSLSNDNKIESSTCGPNDLNTDELKFSEAFNYYRNCGQDIFTWQGLDYTTDIKTDINENLRTNDNDNLLNSELDLVAK